MASKMETRNNILRIDLDRLFMCDKNPVIFYDGMKRLKEVEKTQNRFYRSFNAE